MELAIEFAKYISDRGYLEDFIFMDKVKQEEIFNYFFKDYMNEQPNTKNDKRELHTQR